PSTDLRAQLAESIVGQLYPTLSGNERAEMKNAFYSPSTTIVDSNTGKKS
ncbi:unnamed protein product, partial [Allacma fusca]